ncbi:MAG: SGNH/GDSL hydrolase family protein [Patescibacteria group bacterium]
MNKVSRINNNRKRAKPIESANYVRVYAFLSAVFIAMILLVLMSTINTLFSASIQTTNLVKLNTIPQSLYQQNSIPLMWGDLNTSGISKYTIMRDGVYFTTVPNNTHSFIDTALIPQYTYTYQIYALDKSGNIITKSNTITATTFNSYKSPIIDVNHPIYSVYSAFGDSITQGYETTVSYYDLTSNYLKTTEQTVSYNDGVGGNTTYNLLSRIQGELNQQNPDLVSLMIGTNDLRNGTLQNPAITPLQFKHNVEQIIHDINPGPSRTMFIFSIPYLTNFSGTNSTAGSLGRLQEFNNIIQGLANKYGIPYINTESSMQNMKGILNSDGVHPNNIGDQYIASSLINMIKSYNRN